MYGYGQSKACGLTPEPVCMPLMAGVVMPRSVHSARVSNATMPVRIFCNVNLIFISGRTLSMRGKMSRVRAAHFVPSVLWFEGFLLILMVSMLFARAPVIFGNSS